MVVKTRALFAVVAAFACLCAITPLGLAQAQQITGKWHFVFKTEGGDRTSNPNFDQHEDQVSGKWDDADVKGTFKDGKLDLAFPYNSDEAGPGTLKIKGELKGDTLTGTWEFQDYTGSFKATRSVINQ